MQVSSRKVASIAGLWVVLLALSQPAAAENAAATVEFVFGTATIVSASGAKRAVEKGSLVFPGDTVVTLDARTQLRFTDGGFVALLPGSEFKVNAYSYNGKPDGNERVSMALLKGGLRTISGLIGKSNRSAYEMVTFVATIGIRGTEYTVVYGQSITGTVAAGRIAVCNGAGCLEVGQGQSYYVRDENTKPVFTAKAAQLPPPPPDSTRKGSSSGNGKSGLSVSDVWRSERSQSVAGPDHASGSNAGGAYPITPDASASRGIGYTLIGSTAPNVQDPAQRVSKFLQENLVPGNGNGLAYGKDGKPN